MLGAGASVSDHCATSHAQAHPNNRLLAGGCDPDTSTDKGVRARRCEMFQGSTYTPPTVIRKNVGARDTGHFLNIFFQFFLYYFFIQFFPRFLSTRFLITAISYYRGKRCR